MNTPLNTPQRHGSVPLAHSTPTTLDLGSALGSHTHLIEQAASTATLPAWPQGRGETGRLAFIQSIPNGWTCGAYPAGGAGKVGHGAQEAAE